MKLRNKKTGEIVIFGEGVVDLNQIGCKNVGEMIEAGWEDYEEPKEYWYVYGNQALNNKCDDIMEDSFKEIGNYFETKEEAEKAVEKLKAWKRLEDKGFRPKMWEWEYIYDDNISGELIIKAHIDDATDSDGKYTKDLDLLFGDEE